MEQYYGYSSVVSAFGIQTDSEPLIQTDAASCWSVSLSGEERGLLWRIGIHRTDLEQAVDIDQAAPAQRDAALEGAAAWYLQTMQEMHARVPEGILPVLQAEFRVNLINPQQMMLFCLTPAAQPLRRVWQEFKGNEDRLCQIWSGLCSSCGQMLDAGFRPGCLTPDLVLFSSEEKALLAPWWPGRAEWRPEGFWTEADGERQTLYSLAVLLYWVLNEGEPPFAREAVSAADAEEKRLQGRAVPHPVCGDNPLVRLLLPWCCIPLGQEKTLRGFALELDRRQRSEWERRRDQRERSSRAEEQRQSEEEKRIRRERKLRAQAEREEQKAQQQNIGSESKDKLAMGSILGLVAAVFVVITVVILFSAPFSLQKSLEAGNDANALEQIETRYQNGENVDELVDIYIDDRLEDGDILKALWAAQYYSSAVVPEEQRVEQLVQQGIAGGYQRRVRGFLEDFSQKNEACAQLAQRMTAEYAESME